MLQKASFRHLNKMSKFKKINLVGNGTVAFDTRQCSTKKPGFKSDPIEPTKIFSEKIINRLGCHDFTLDDSTYETFITILPHMVKESLLDSLEDEMITVFHYFKERSDYIIGSNREFYVAPALLNACKAFTEPKHESPESVRLACTLTWCFEITAMGGLLLDDLLDNGTMRRGKPCLHKINGAKAISTATLLRTTGPLFLKKFFKDHPRYKSFLNILSDISFKTYIGQLLDENVSHQFRKYRNLDVISMDKYLLLTKYKRSYFQLKCPVLAAMCFHNKHLEEFPKIENVFDKLSLQLQTTNDMWDCYGNYETFGRIGTDVSEARCTWLTATAVECMNTKQKVLFRQHYGKKDRESQNIIKTIYRDIKIPEKYAEQTLHIREELISELQKTDQLEIRNLLQSFVDTVFA